MTLTLPSLDQIVPWGALVLAAIYAFWPRVVARKPVSVPSLTVQAGSDPAKLQAAVEAYDAAVRAAAAKALEQRIGELAAAIKVEAEVRP
jgi:uncharacterized protein (UPF0264 family)